VHSTNYTNTFIAVADDCKAAIGTAPPERREKTIARLHYEYIYEHPYRYTSDELLLAVQAMRQQLDPQAYAAMRAAFFSKGQPCLRSSPLAKTYGWGIHFDSQSHVAIYPRESDDYRRLQVDAALAQLRAMRSAR
jgi:hypothetical protein